MHIRKTEKGLEFRLPKIFRGISSSEIFKEIEEQMEYSREDLILDMKETTLIDSSALGKFILVAKELKPFGKKIVVVNTSNNLKNFFAQLRIDSLFEIE